MFFGHDIELPDTGELCCYGYAGRGPHGCTCWETVYDIEQQPVVPGPAVARETMCGDCAFRGDSPERAGDSRYQHSEDGDLEALVESDATFACHRGMRRRIALVHPSGARVETGPGDYAPAMVGGIAYKADGSPADICAGLCARRRAAR